MKKGLNIVEGIVRDRYSKAGISELQVVLYDIDEAKREFSDMGVVGPIVSDDDSIEPHIVDPTTGPPANISIDQATRPDARTWVNFSGDRLGSVLTDRNGRFILEYSDDLFQLGEKERRPDLVLLVLGPDHSKGVSIISRLLHYSYVPRNNAGRRENYIIHIDRPDDEDRAAENKRLRGFFGQLNSPRVSEQRESKKSFVNSIAGMLLPFGISKSKTFVSPHAPQQEVATAVMRAIASGVEHVGLDARTEPTVLHVSEGMRAEIAPTVAVGAEFSANACDILALKGIGTNLSRIRSLLSQRQAEEAAQDTLESTEDTTEERLNMPVIADTSEADAFIAGRVLGQIESLPVIDKGKPSRIIDDLQTIKDRINELEMSGGPANVTAFRDFHSLQIAFKDVWTAALDRELEDSVASLYDRINEVNRDYGNPFPSPSTVSDLALFRDYAASIDESLSSEAITQHPLPEHIAQWFPEMDYVTWNTLTSYGRLVLDGGILGIVMTDADDAWKRVEAQELLDRVVNNYSNLTTIGRIKRLIVDIDQRLTKPYSFKYYKEYSVNYGILVNYRQEWRPQNYQVGRLVSTLPLAPGESRELKIKSRVKLTRAEKEVRKSLLENNYEQTSSSKSELDVLAKMSTDSNFKMSASGSFTLGIGSIESASEFSHNQKAESQRQHKQISEATRKASEKVRQEREISVEQTTESEFSTEATQKIHNPNNEVTVTYLMYELERRYHVSQTLNRVTPVIMVALDMPSPHEITEGWVLEYAWILKRVLLDDQFLDAIKWIENGLQSQTLEIAVGKATYEREMSTMQTVENNLDLILGSRRLARASVIDLQRQKDEYEAGADDASDKIKDFFMSGGFSLFENDAPDEGSILQAGIDAAESKLKYLDESSEELTSQLRAAKRESRMAGEKYTAVLKTFSRTRTNIKQLQLHIRQNIFHYMHAIWETKHPDELFFQLVEQEVYHADAGARTCRFIPTTPRPAIPGILNPDSPYRMVCDPPVVEDLSGLSDAEIETVLESHKKPLGQIAHVDQLLGFKGNYAIFPLRSCTSITDFMMKEFIDDYLGVRDPATELGVSSEELIEYAKVLRRDPDVPTEIKEQLATLVREVLSSPSHNTEEIILPTGQIYMEALKGEQALLEDFKLAHRGMDVLKVQEEVRSERLDNLRKAARLVSSEQDLSDPDIDKKVLVSGDSSVIVDTE